MHRPAIDEGPGEAHVRDETVWVPDSDPAPAHRGAEIAIRDSQLRRLVVHHLARAGTFQHAETTARVVAFEPGQVPQPGHIYVARTNADICDFTASAELAGPVGLAAAADLDQLDKIVLGVMNGLACRGPVAAAVAAAGASLSSRNLRILELVAAGYTNAEIADQLSFSLTTIKRDITLLFDMFGATSRRGLVRKASELGLVRAQWGVAPSGG